MDYLKNHRCRVVSAVLLFSLFTISHTLNLNVENGNYIPADIDGNGLFFINDNGQLILSDVWLGSPSDRKCTGACGHLLSRD